MKRYYRTCGWVAAVCLMLFGGHTLLEEHGYVHTTRKPNRWFLGCICHAETASVFVDVGILGPESLSVGQVGTYTVFVIRDSNIGAGFNVATFFGALLVGDTSEQRLIDDELTHAVPKLSGGSDTIGWTFFYQAPDSSVYDTLYATGMAANMNSNPEGDHWNLSDNFVVRVHPLTAAPLSFDAPLTFHLSQNYPNPFNSSTTFSFEFPYSSVATLTIYNVLGQEIIRLIDGTVTKGRYRVSWDARGTPTGLYLLRLQTTTTSLTRKMLLIK